MTDRAAAPDPYLAEHLKEVLTCDPRVSGLNLGVTLTANAVVVTGELASAEQRQAVETVIHELLPTYNIRNETAIVDLPEPTDAEAMS